jgi:hypothetical protein
MPGYVQAALKRFEHLPSARPQHGPHRYNRPNYGAQMQAPDALDTSALLSQDKRL